MPVPGDRLRAVVDVWAFDDGSLWVHHDRGRLTVFRGNMRRTFTSADGLPDHARLELVRDGAGTVWAAGRGGVARLVDGQWQAEPALAGGRGRASGLLVDRAGALWVSGADHIDVRRPGADRFERLAVPGGVARMVDGPDGRLWGLGNSKEPGGRVRPLGVAGGDTRPAAEIAPGGIGIDLLFDRRGALWTGGPTDGLSRARAASGLPETPVETFTERDGLTRNEVMALFQDREDNIWVGTSGGLDLFRETALTTAPLPPMHAAKLAAGPDGVMWVGAQNHALLRVTREGVEPTEVPTRVGAVAVDPRSDVWAWASGALWRGTAGRFSPLPGSSLQPGDQAWALAFDDTGRLWGTFALAGLKRWAGGHWEAPVMEGLPADQGRPRLIVADRAHRLWLGYESGAVARVTGQRAQTLALPTGPEFGSLTGLVDTGSRVWLARRGGLAAVDGDRVRQIAGLDEDSIGIVQGLARHDDGSLWLNASHGIVRVTAAELERALADPTVTPHFRVFDYLDGVVGGAALRPPLGAIATPWGQLWFVAYDSVLALDPTRLADSPPPPPVQVRAVRAGDRDYAVADGLRLPVGTTTVRVAYTGLSLTMPDRIRFRYRLDGVDDGWQEAGPRREAAYANLRPGAYTFRVIASNNNGVWPEAGATASFVVPPALHQTLAFRLAAAVAAAGLVWAAFRLRVRQVTAQLHGRLAARVAERERIARELHDTLLQGVQGLILRFQAVASRLPSNDPAAHSMEDALSRADDVLAEGRARVRDLRRSAEATADLAEALAHGGAALAAGTGTSFTVTTEGEPRPLHPIVRDEAFWVVHEGIANAIRHAGARCIEADVSYAADGLRVRCRDDGIGMDPAVAAAGRPEHFGLRGMRERAQRIGGHLNVWSGDGAGTEIELQVPSAMAYADAPPARWSWWRQAWSDGER